MARQRRSTPAPRAAPRTQTRSAHTAAAPVGAATAPPPGYSAAHPQQQSSSPGLFGQMASTAAGVAVGSTIGHTLGAGITGLFGGSSSAPAEPVQQQQVVPTQQSTYNTQSVNCDVDARNFTRCLEDNGGNMTACDFYLQQLKACQEASRQY